MRSDWQPSSLRELSDCVDSAAREKRALNVVGAGTAQSWGGDSRGDTTLQLSQMDSVLQYEPSDMTIQVGAGMTVLDLQSTVAEYGQRLALDAARIDRGATIGGVFASADQGPAQLVFGGPRDLVIGATLVLADGQVVRSGGHVIKNVAGYDLARLVSGSLGTLAVIADLTFRLHPKPAATGSLRIETGIGQAVAYAKAIAGASLDPVAAEWLSGHLLVRFEGTPSGVRERLEASARIVGASNNCILDADESAEAWTLHGMVTAPSGREEPEITVLRGLVRPSEVFEVVQAGNRIALEHESMPTVAAGLLTGRVDFRIAAALLPTHAAVVTQWRQVIEGLGGAMILRDRPVGLTDLIDAWGVPPSAAAILRAVKHAYDPGGLLGPGRFHPWF
ncbi:FAD-binding oxidoreductase [Mycolicibacterium frederiksbergense]|uniref:FAD-binding oxidoreductase n=1 Tax=Mycolicibacterium frederiksbergense TaxID=117567 RepID=UPI00399AA423